MTDTENKKTSPAIAAAIILVCAGLLLYFMPKLVMWISTYSPALAVAVGAVIVCGFFILFWIRSRFQKR
ncbi:hypothetical protein [Rhizobium sp. L1K21]|uniref:hypothetical protein n=1 Tax=Rhizobium sp. L1K21 TaxID=2954933 RepID=UPI002093A8CA|nr:hypothetical protein [Rhizobium sp. L1K21]MCO6184965.1 hypothetical protein [Rhizobium sp. L1K21]